MSLAVKGYVHEDLLTKLQLITDLLMHVRAVHTEELSGEQKELLDSAWSKCYDVRKQTKYIAHDGTIDHTSLAIRYRGG